MRQLSGDIKAAVNEPQVKGLDKAMSSVAKPRFNPLWLRWGAYGAGGVAIVFFIGLIVPGLVSPAEDAAQSPMSRAETTTASPAMESEAKKGGISEPARAPADADGSVRGRSMSESQPVEGGDATFGLGPDSEENRGFSGAGGGVAPTDDQKVRVQKSKAQSNAPTVFEKDRIVVRNAELGLKVKDVAKAVEETERTVMAMGGIVGSTNFDMAVDTSRATMDFKIPVHNFSAILDTLSKLGKVTRKTTNGDDVTAQVADADGRIRALADEEHNLIAELQRARNTGTRLEIRSRLSYVRQELEGMKEQNTKTKDLAAMSRVAVSFEQSGQLDQSKPDDWFNQTTEGAGTVLGFFGRVMGVGLIYTLFLAPVWLPIAGLVWWMKRRAVRTVQ